MDPKNIKIDKENRQLLGVIAVEQIDIKDWRPFSVNETFISDLVAFAAKQKEGVKSNFGHNYNNLGKQLGRATNWRIEDNKAKFDLTIAKYADSSPGLPNLGKYVMEVLEEDNAACMCSIVFKEKYYYQLDKAGAEVKVYYYNKSTERWVEPIQEYGKVYPKFDILKSVDIVEEGAATNSMFELEDIDQNDQGAMNSFFSFFKNLFTNQKMQEMANEHTPATPEIPATTPAAPVTLEALAQQLSTLTETVSKLSPQTPPATPAATTTTPAATPETPAPSADATQLAALQKQVQELEAKLAAEPAAPPATPESGAGGGTTDQKELWELDPLNIQAANYMNSLNLKK